MAKKAPQAAGILENAAAATAKILMTTQGEERTDTGTPAKEIPAPEPEKKPGPGRPKGNRTAKLNLTLTEAHKDFLRRLCFERSSATRTVTASDVIADLIQAEIDRRA